MKKTNKNFGTFLKEGEELLRGMNEIELLGITDPAERAAVKKQLSKLALFFEQISRQLEQTLATPQVRQK